MTTKNRWISAVAALFCMTAFEAHSDNTNTAVAAVGIVDSTSIDLRLTESRRQDFLAADRAISAGQLTKARALMSSLGDYALVPYLELEIMLRDLYRVPSEQVEAFIEQHQDTWVGEKARLNWLVVLNTRRKYSDYIRHFQHVEPTTTTRCQYLRALIATGRAEEAYQQAPALWLSGNSRPDACDYLFSNWRKSAYFSEEYIWQRFLLARQARQYGLARYLTSQAKTPLIKQRIASYHRLRNKPDLVANKNNFNFDDPETSQLIQYGLTRLADRHVDKAQNLFDQYMQMNLLDLVEQQAVVESLMEAWTENNAVDNAKLIAQQYPQLMREQQLDWQLRQSLEQQDWRSVLTWFELVDEESKQSDKWQYWMARAKSQLGQSAEETFAALTQERSYYGHLSSLFSAQPFQLNDAYIDSDPELVERIRNSPGAQQAFELNAVRYYLNSRNAWNIILEPLSEPERIAAGQVAHEMELHYSAIVSMAKSGFWNNLKVRFPVAHQDSFEQAAKQQNISAAWAYGISRQESSFAADIRSSAGATGLMQVMPATAREMARKTGVSYDRSKLRDPDYNIPLGVAYLHEGLEQLGGNMIYATAGYNAGIGRAKIWLKNGKDQLPLDIWAEIIPYTETRKYVKYVMDYSLIYADKLGVPAPLQELNPRLFVNSP